MKVLRNTEILKGLLFNIAIGAGAVGATLLIEPALAVVTLIISILFIAVYLVGSASRYRNISMLAADINKILHGKGEISLNRYSEGELAILESEIYKMTVRLREQKQQLIADKVYLADSIADISHQIRTPLTSINLLVSLLSEGNITEERRRELSEELLQLLSRIEWLITTLLKISRLDAGTVELKKENKSLQEVIEQSISTLLIPIELKRQKLKIKAEGDFLGDISWTAEAIGNIVKNCMEHTPDGGVIKITGEENPLFTEIVVEDSGKGIEKEDLPHIFERFYKGKNSDEKSFGVGLALARMIILKQNGTVKAENKTEGGAKFTLRFYKGTV